MGGRKQRLLIIGLSGVKGSKDDLEIKSYSWDKLDRVPAVRDFDWVMLHVAAIADHNSVDWNLFFRLFDPFSTKDVIVHGGRFIVTGCPVFNCPLSGDNSRPFLFWTGLDFTWNETPGESVEISSDRYFKRYYDSIRRWKHSLKSVEVGNNLRTVLGLDRNPKARLSLSTNARCWNRNREPLSFEIKAHLYVDDGRTEKHRELGSFDFFLNSSLSPDDLAATVLKGIFGLEVSSDTPPWIEQLAVVGQDAIDAKISESKDQIGRYTELLKEQFRERDQLRSPLKVLFEVGTPLEKSVQEILTELGAAFLPPVRAGADDGCFIVRLANEEAPFVLEVKSTSKNTIGEDGLRQLLEWKNTALFDRGLQCKGLLVVNSAVASPPSERENPFNEQLLSKARMADAVVMTTHMLFTVHQEIAKGTYSREQFWRTIIDGRGEVDFFDLPALREVAN